MAMALWCRSNVNDFQDGEEKKDCVYVNVGNRKEQVNLK